MPITQSTIVEDMPQIDGRRTITERHAFADGHTEEVNYWAEAKDDVEAAMADRVAILEEAAEFQAAQRQAEQKLEKEQAVAVLKLPDSEIKAVLKLGSLSDVAAEKQRLQVSATKAAGGK